MIALRKPSCEQALVGHRRIFPGYQERRHQVGCGSTGTVGHSVRRISVMDHDCSLTIRLGTGAAVPQLRALLGLGVACTLRLFQTVTKSGNSLPIAFRPRY